MQTGAWIVPDERPLPAELVAFLDAGPPPVYVGFGSMRGVPEDIARVTIEAIRAQGRRVLVGHGWADLGLIDDRDDCFVIGEVNQQALFGRVAAVVHHGGAGTTTTAARAGAPQVVVPQAGGTSRTGLRGWPNWASARHTTVRLRPPSPCPPGSGRRWHPRPAHERPLWPARSAPTERRWPRGCCSTRSAGIRAEDSSVQKVS